MAFPSSCLRAPLRMGQHHSEYIFARDFAIEERHCQVQFILGAGCAKKLMSRKAPSLRSWQASAQDALEEPEPPWIVRKQSNR